MNKRSGTEGKSRIKRLLSAWLDDLKDCIVYASAYIYAPEDMSRLERLRGECCCCECG
jgi:hypothetical protein